MILIYFYNIVSEFYENIYFSNWRPYIAEKNEDKWKKLTLYPTENGIFFLKQCPPPRDTSIPLKHDYIFIKEVDTPNGISYHRGEPYHTRLLVFGEGGMKVTRYKNVILLTYLRSVLIFIKQYSDSMCFSSIFSLK